MSKKNKKKNTPFEDTLVKYMTLASNAHERVGHRYDNYPYAMHLNMVFQYAVRYKYCLHNCNLFTPEYIENILIAVWTHDLIEDCRYTYNDVLKEFNKDVAEITFAVTNEKGKTRSERANEKYYMDMLDTPGATFIKICDRLANVKYSLDTNSSMFNKYKKEKEHFKHYLGYNYYDDMFKELDEMFKQEITKSLIDGTNKNRTSPR